MIRKAVIPAAGLGTRFLPATKAQPKEMLPIVDTPVIQLVVEEAVASGITDILIISGRGKRAVENHFDRSPDLERHLEVKGDLEALEAIRRPAELADIHFVRQREQRGLGDAILCARHHVGAEPFAVLLGDTIFASEVPATRQLLEAWEEGGPSLIAVEETAEELLGRYGVIRGRETGTGLIEVGGVVEKPAPGKAPSRLAVAGRYLLTPAVFDILADLPPGRGGEIQLTDALDSLAGRGELAARVIEGRRYDIGSKLDFVLTNLDFALQRPEFSDALRRHLAAIVAGTGGDR